MLSVVVPVYDVERYVEECLDSVLAADYPHLQVIVVDDGSPDRSYEIACRYAARDRRVTVLRQANGGLSAARNTGIAAATGTYLTFLDSDDRVHPTAYRLMVETLERTGSDFAVGCYRRFDSRRSFPAARWIRDAHERTRLRTSVEQFPAALVNAVPWSKVYRSSFWREAGLAFPPGVLYEDQATSARAYARARRFDLLSTVTHDWRAREDRSSISQQLSSTPGLVERFAAVEQTLAELREATTARVVDARVVQLLSNDMPQFIAATPEADDAFWSVLVAGVGRLAEQVSEEGWREVASPARALVHLVRSGLRDEVEAFLAAGGRDVARFPTSAHSGRVLSHVPLPAVLGEQVQEELRELSPAQTRLVTAVRRVRSLGPEQLEIDAWAYVDNVDLAGVDQELSVWLRERRTGQRLPVPHVPTTDLDVVRQSRHRYCDSSPSAFRAVVPVPALLAAHASLGRDSTTWEVGVDVAVAGVHRSGVLQQLDPAGSAGALTALVHPSGRRLVPVDGPW